MIAVERKGRLGNQLFQFAFGIAAAERLGTAFVMADDQLRRIFTLGRYGGERRRTVHGLRFRLGHRLRPYPLVDEDSFPDPESLLARLEDRRQYTGYFQSERYFAEQRKDVVGAFAFLPEHERRFAERYADLLERDYVCCHVRRGDYLLWEGGIALPADYYRDGLRKLDPPPDAPIVFVGDDFEGLREELDDIPGSRFEHNDEALDLLLIVRASAIVTSNSSFGWWGAYLNGSPCKRVLAPRRWMGFKQGTEFPPHVIPPAWEQVTVR